MVLLTMIQTVQYFEWKTKENEEEAGSKVAVAGYGGGSSGSYKVRMLGLSTRLSMNDHRCFRK